jgi:transcriptional regulator of acetoin/glycerol metabolism
MSSHTTTEEHRPPSGDVGPVTRPVLLAAFPQSIALALPRAGEVVGRAWFAAAGLRDTEISGQHLRFTRADDRLRVEDAGSRNGTWIDGVRLAPGERAPLRDGAVLRVGRTVLVHRAAHSGEMTPADPVGHLVGPFGLGEVRARLARLKRLGSRADRNVLVHGATGTGKELVAAAVMHALGRTTPRVTINVAAIPAGVFAAQLFGWTRGAYSGADVAGDGVFRKGDGGSVFLDEIGELPLELQVGLLRLIQNGEVQPVGSAKPVQVDVAIIAATNRELDEAVERGAFRRDLLARFVERIALPALADRAEDVYAILGALARGRGVDLDPDRVEVEAVERLLLHDWPANVRELDRVAAALDADTPLTRVLVDRLLGSRSPRGELTREEAERMVRECGGNEREVERRFGISRGKLRRALGK